MPTPMEVDQDIKKEECPKFSRETERKPFGDPRWEELFQRAKSQKEMNDILIGMNTLQIKK